MIVIPVLHPAHEVIARVEGLALGAVGRAVETWSGVGGKAVNVARFAATLGAPVRLIVLGDDSILAALGADALLAGSGGAGPLDMAAVRSPVPSRTDVTLVDTGGGVTVANGTAAHPGDAALSQVLAATLGVLGRDDVLVLAGSTPAGTADAYRQLAAGASARGARVIVDASGASLTAALAGVPWAVKVNEAEAAAASVSPGVAPLLAITDGARGLRAWLPDGAAVRVRPPHDVPVTSTLGAGDAVTAGLAIEAAAGASPLHGLLLGTAMAAASLRHLDVRLDPGEVRALLPRVVVEALA